MLCHWQEAYYSSNCLCETQTPFHSPNLTTILFGDILNPELTSFTSCFMPVAIPRSHLRWPCLSMFYRHSHLSDDRVGSHSINLIRSLVQGNMSLASPKDIDYSRQAPR